MGACKSCGEIFGVLELKNGICEKCMAERKVEVTPQQVSKLIPCGTCGKKISRTAKFCPNCGESFEHLQDNTMTEEVNNERSLGMWIFLTVGTIALGYIVIKAWIKIFSSILNFSF